MADVKRFVCCLNCGHTIAAIVHYSLISKVACPNCGRPDVFGPGTSPPAHGFYDAEGVARLKAQKRRAGWINP